MLEIRWLLKDYPSAHTLCFIFHLHYQRKFFRTGEEKKKKRISFLNWTRHICNITFSFKASGNPVSLGFKSAHPSFCLTEAQNCLFIGLFIIRMSAAEGESIQKTFQLQFCSEDTRRYLTHLNIIKIICHRIRERSEQERCIETRTSRLLPSSNKEQFVYTHVNPVLHLKTFFIRKFFFHYVSSVFS